MSLYEVISMNVEMEQSSSAHKPEVSDAEWEQANELLKSVTVNDPSVRLH